MPAGSYIRCQYITYYKKDIFKISFRKLDNRSHDTSETIKVITKGWRYITMYNSVSYFQRHILPLSYVTEFA